MLTSNIICEIKIHVLCILIYKHIYISYLTINKNIIIHSTQKMKTDTPSYSFHLIFKMIKTKCIYKLFLPDYIRFSLKTWVRSSSFKNDDLPNFTHLKIIEIKSITTTITKLEGLSSWNRIFSDTVATSDHDHCISTGSLCKKLWLFTTIVPSHFILKMFKWSNCIHIHPLCQL